jgi:hypothetical protein
MSGLPPANREALRRLLLPAERVRDLAGDTVGRHARSGGDRPPVKHVDAEYLGWRAMGRRPEIDAARACRPT